MQYLITGATGNVGSRIVEALIDAGAQTKIVVRDASKARLKFGGLVEIFTGDLQQVDTLIPAFEGTDILFLVNSGPNLAAQDQQAAEMARRCGIKRIVKLSSFDSRKNVGTGKWHAAGESVIRATGIDFTFVQPSGFMSNALLWANTVRSRGVIRSATGSGKIPFIHPRDIAAVSVKALLSDQYTGASLPISGPEALSYSAMGDVIGDAIGKTVTVEAIGEDGVREEQLSAGVSEKEVDAHLSIYRAIREGVLSEVATGVEAVLGRPPLSFETWVSENVESFR